MMYFRTSFFVLAAILICISCEQDESFSMKRFLNTQSEEIIRNVVADPEKYESQMIYVQIDRDEYNQPTFTQYEWNVDDQRYFYPASTVKMPTAIIALEKLRDLNIRGLNLHTQMEIDSVRPPQTPVKKDSSAQGYIPTIGHYTKHIFVVSDNDAHNRLYEFVGQDELHKRLRSHGIDQTRIIHRLGNPAFGPEENRYTNPVRFIRNDEVIYEQKERHAQLEHPDQLIGSKRGVGYADQNGDIVNEPFDFTRKNFFPLNDQVGVVKRIFFPESFSEDEQFNLSEGDLNFVRTKMGMLPKESRYPLYQDSVHYDSYVKFFIFGDQEEPMPESIRIYNKVGWAYGYLTDCAYIVDFEKGIEFILASTIHVNENQIYNDGEYEYEEIGMPYLAALGRAFYAYEENRVRIHKPNLEHLNLRYSEFK